MSVDDETPKAISEVLIEDLGNTDTVAKKEAANKVRRCNFFSIPLLIGLFLSPVNLN